MQPRLAKNSDPDHCWGQFLHCSEMQASHEAVSTAGCVLLLAASRLLELVSCCCLCLDALTVGVEGTVQAPVRAAGISILAGRTTCSTAQHSTAHRMFLPCKATRFTDSVTLLLLLLGDGISNLEQRL